MSIFDRDAEGGRWEFHRRHRNIYGQFEADPDGHEPIQPMNLRLPVPVVERIRDEAGQSHMQYGQYVAHALREYWDEKIASAD